jgi:hypothetical protein
VNALAFLNAQMRWFSNTSARYVFNWSDDDQLCILLFHCMSSLVEYDLVRGAHDVAIIATVML